ncbi:MAG: BsuPI-related putative proteinase inhibitor [Gemmatimonadales bacterium]
MNKTVLVPLAVAAAAVWTCGRNSLTDNSGPITLSVTFPSPARAGDTVPVTLDLTNTASASVRFVHGGFSDRIYFDVIVTQRDGSVVWSRLHRQTLLAAAHSRVLAPGETIELAAEWALRDNAGTPVAAGEYRVRGVLFGIDPDLRSEAKPLVILP